MSTTDNHSIDIDLARQTLTLRHHGRVVSTWPVSTALKGAGERMDSGQTPRGRHRVRLLIGDGCQKNCVFVGRRATGEIYSEALARAQPRRDWILTRIIWLTGCEPGFNRGGDRDTLRRFIYIHGCPDTEPMGVPKSHGCIRMRNADIVTLFEQVQVGTPVMISDDASA
jgi:hypothetical protein